MIITTTGEYQSRLSDSYRSTFNFNLMASITAAVSAAAVLAVDAITYQLKENFLSIGYFIAYCIPLITNNLMLLQFCTIILVVRKRFEWINEMLENTAITSYTKVFLQSCQMSIVHLKRYTQKSAEET